EYHENRLSSPLMSRHEIGSFYSQTRGVRECPFCKERLEELEKTSFPGGGREDYDDYISASSPSFFDEGIKPIKESLMDDLRHMRHTPPHANLVEQAVTICRLCGWWTAYRETVASDASGIEVN